MESQNQQILELLGFSGGEHFDSAKALVEDTSADWEAFHKTIPFPLLVAAKDLLSDTPTKGISMLKARMDPETFEETKNIVRKNFAKLLSHPHFKSALQEGFREQWKPAGLADVDFHSVSITPLLIGFAPPHYPLLKIEVKDRKEDTIISEQCHWADAIFLFHALAQGVADHSADLASKIDAGDCAKPPTKAVKDWIAETRNALNRIEDAFDGLD